MFCVKCGSEIADGSKFCPKCGAQLAAPAAPGSSGAERQGHGPCPTGAGSPDSGAAAPLKRKPNGKVIGAAVAAVVVAVVVAGVAIANPFATPEPAPEPEPAPVAAPEPAPEPASEPELAPEPEPEPAVEAPSIPETCFSKRAGTEGPFELYNMQGEEVMPAIEEAEFAGPFSGGVIVGLWNTEEYDEEFETAYDKKNHVGIFDGEGKLTGDLTEKLYAVGVPNLFTVSRSEALCYSNGRLVVPVYYTTERTEPREDGKMYDEFRRAFVFDTAGEIVFEFEYASETVHYASDWGSFAYHDGVLLAHKPSSFGEVIYDVDGKVLVDCDGNQFDSLTPYGYGYYSYGVGQEPVLAYDGAVALDPATLNVDGIVNASVSGVQPLTGGAVAVSAEKENPHEGGKNLAVEGVYSLAEGRWLFPLEKDLESGEGYGGVFPILQNSEKPAPTASADGTEATADSSDEAAEPFARLVNGKGETVFDATMLGDSLAFKFVDGYEHLHDGYWKVDGFTYDTNDTVVIYIKDGVYQGYQTFDFALS